MGWTSDAIEWQLAHSERNLIKAAYNLAERLPEHRKMMQAQADYLDRLREKQPTATQLRVKRACPQQLPSTH